MSRRALLITVALVLALAAPTDAAVQKLIQGKQIASGAIQPRHLSPKTRKLGWLHKTRVYSFVEFSYNSTGPKTTTATCPPGSTLLAGGFSTGTELVDVTRSAPNQAGDGWEATGKYVGGSILDVLYAYALCAS